MGIINNYIRVFNKLVEQSVPYTSYRWLAFTALLLAFVIRILLAQQWFLVTYTLGIYLLNMLLQFLQPKFDPAMAGDGLGNDSPVAADGPQLPTTSSGGDGGEFKPFIRKLPEYKFWYGATRATIMSLMCTLTQLTDIPVFWYHSHLISLSHTHTLISD